MNSIFYHIFLRYPLKTDKILQIYITPQSTSYLIHFFFHSPQKELYMGCAFLSFPKYGFILFQHIFEYIEVTLVEKEKTIFFQNISFFAMIKKKSKTSLAVQWLRLRALTSGALGLFPGYGNKFSHAMQTKQF